MSPRTPRRGRVPVDRARAPHRQGACGVERPDQIYQRSARDSLAVSPEIFVPIRAEGSGLWLGDL
jgi:hypothetical protein